MEWCIFLFRGFFVIIYDIPKFRIQVHYFMIIGQLWIPKLYDQFTKFPWLKSWIYFQSEFLQLLYEMFLWLDPEAIRICCIMLSNKLLISANSIQISIAK